MPCIDDMAQVSGALVSTTARVDGGSLLTVISKLFKCGGYWQNELTLMNRSLTLVPYGVSLLLVTLE